MHNKNMESGGWGRWRWSFGRDDINIRIYVGNNINEHGLY